GLLGAVASASIVQSEAPFPVNPLSQSVGNEPTGTRSKLFVALWANDAAATSTPASVEPNRFPNPTPVSGGRRGQRSLDRARQIGGLAPAPVMQKEYPRSFMRHVLM